MGKIVFFVWDWIPLITLIRHSRC